MPDRRSKNKNRNGKGVKKEIGNMPEYISLKRRILEINKWECEVARSYGDMANGRGLKV